MSWVNDAAVPNHHGNGFPQITDPSAVAGTMMDPSAFMGGPTQFNQQFANPQSMIMPNGPMRNASPGFANSMYQTNPVVPTKQIDVFIQDEYVRSYSIVLGFVNAPIFDQDYVDRARTQMQADGWSAEEVQLARFVVRDRD